LTPNARRLDVAVAEQLGASRSHAQALIIEGRVRVDGTPASKAGALVAEKALIEVIEDAKYVGRGGLKLERALDEFDWSPAGLRCLDVGASTGGFTDCLLQRGAASVTAVDVGYGQLAWSLRNDPSVRVIERCNFRNADPVELGAPFAFVCADVSFISLAKLAPAFAGVLADEGRLIVLVKPQFEAGRQWVKRGGVVRDDEGRREAIESVISAFAEAGILAEKLTHSPIKGPAGNIEFLLGARFKPNAALKSDVVFRASEASSEVPKLDVAGAVKKANEAL